MAPPILFIGLDDDAAEPIPFIFIPPMLLPMTLLAEDPATL
jgi:hypothetical protein